jgi:endonuclease YncB( thermonuclease family)
MKKLLTLALVATFAAASFAATTPATPKGVKYTANITRVIDGDTVAFEAKWLPAPLKKELSIRVYGVDTPEKGFRAKCPAEDKLGHDASDFTISTVAAATKKEIVLYDWDKYGGRVLGDVILDGKSLRAMLIERKYAREYYGDAKQSWCN